MFDQSLYDQEKAAESAPVGREGDLFGNYELKSWDLSPRLYKILGISAAVNVLALLVFAQTSVLTMKGCDSPLVGSVCQALDTVYIGTLLFGTQREYVDQQYEKTDLGNADITYLDYTGVQPPLSYPDGYFQLANPEQFVAQQQPVDPLMSGATPGFPNFTIPGQPNARPMTGNNMFNTKPNYPRPPRNNVVQGNLPSGVNDNGTVADANSATNSRRPSNGKGNSNSGNPTVDNSNTGSNKTDDNAVEDKNGISINKRPLKDKANETLAQLDAGVSLDKPFKVVIAGMLGLGKDGKTIILKDPKPMPIDKDFPSDPTLTKLAQEWVLAIGDAGWYGYLGILDKKKHGIGRKVVITVEQNDNSFTANLTSEQPTPEEANTSASLLRNAMTVGAFAVNEDELTFLKSLKTTSDGKMLVVNFEMPKQQAQEMIQRKLAEQKNAPKQPNGNAVTKPAVNAGK